MAVIIEKIFRIAFRRIIKISGNKDIVEKR